MSTFPDFTKIDFTETASPPAPPVGTPGPTLCVPRAARTSATLRCSPWPISSR